MRLPEHVGDSAGILTTYNYPIIHVFSAEIWQKFDWSEPRNMTRE